MPRKRKNELPSGNTRKLVYDHSELVYDDAGIPIIDPKTGKQKKKRVYISVTGSDPAEVKMAAIKLKQNKSETRIPSSMTLRDAIKKYIAMSEATLSPTTISSYKTILNFAFQDIMDKRITDIDKIVLKNAVSLEAQRKVTNRNNHHTVSEKTLKNEYGLITSVLKLYKPDVDTKMKLKQPEKKFRDLPSPDKIIEVIKGTDVELPVLLAMWMSFTMSEIRGLTKDSITKDGNYICIKQVMVTYRDKTVVKPQAKNEKRNRKHRIPLYIKKLISKVDTHYLVTMTEKQIYSKFQALTISAGFDRISFHDLRHISASVMAVLHIPDKYAQDRGGWTSDGTMKRVYTETFSPERIAVDNKIDTYFDNAISGKSIDSEKYRSYLLLFGKSDCEKSRKDFEEFQAQMQHEIQHGIKKAP